VGVGPTAERVCGLRHVHEVERPGTDLMQLRFGPIQNLRTTCRDKF
jgi:hypothetical protein